MAGRTRTATRHQIVNIHHDKLFTYFIFSISLYHPAFHAIIHIGSHIHVHVTQFSISFRFISDKVWSPGRLHLFD